MQAESVQNFCFTELRMHHLAMLATNTDVHPKYSSYVAMSTKYTAKQFS